MSDYICAAPFAHTAGAKHPKMVLVGEAWGAAEEETGQPFVGESGKLLFQILGDAMPTIAPELHEQIMSQQQYGHSWLSLRDEWFAVAGIALTNVLAFRPKDNKLDNICCKKAELPHGYDYPAIAHGKYLLSEYLPELSRLFEELGQWRPNLVVALGNTATWALLRATNIGSIRGAITEVGGFCGNISGIKTLPTYHPAGVLRQWGWRPIVVADFIKASRECQFPEIRRPQRAIIVNPSIEEVEAWTSSALSSASILSCDIETEFQQIKCVGFARSRSDAIVIPFVDKKHKEWSYWEEQWIERRAWDCVEKLLSCSVPKLFQNGMYDLQYLLRYGLHCNAIEHDTMLLHHSIFPEMKKGLGFLGSIYTAEASWKLMRNRKADTEKRDE